MTNGSKSQGHHKRRKSRTQRSGVLPLHELGYHFSFESHTHIAFIERCWRSIHPAMFSHRTDTPGLLRLDSIAWVCGRMVKDDQDAILGVLLLHHWRRPFPWTDCCTFPFIHFSLGNLVVGPHHQRRSHWWFSYSFARFPQIPPTLFRVLVLSYLASLCIIGGGTDMHCDTTGWYRV